MKNSIENITKHFDYVAHKLNQHLSYITKTLKELEIFDEINLEYYGFSSNVDNSFYSIQDIIDNKSKLEYLLESDFSFRDNLVDVSTGVSLKVSERYINYINYSDSPNMSEWDGIDILNIVVESLQNNYRLVDQEIEPGGNVWMVLYVREDIMSDYNKIDNIFKKLHK